MNAVVFRSGVRGAMRWGMGLAVALALVGCAVLTVDVDVYKGPLANHEDVQARQIEGMVIGSKPLLVELRWRLEADAANEARPRATVPGEVEDSSTYVSDYDWKSPEARLLNEIVGLYQDKRDLESTAARRRALIEQRGRAAAERARAAYRRYSPETRRRVSPRVAPHQETTRLGLAVDEFLAPSLGSGSDRRDVGGVIRAVDALHGVGAMSNGASRSELLSVPNLQYETLLRLATDDPAFGQAVGSRVALDEVIEISKAYLATGEAFEALWTALLEGVIELDALGEHPRAASERALITTTSEALAVYSLEIAQPLHVRIAAELASGDSRFAPLRSSLDAAGLPMRGWDSSDYQTAKRVLLDRFRHEPGETARALLELQEWVGDGARLSSALARASGRLDNTRRYPSAWRRGLVRAPADALDKPAQLDARLAQVSENLAILTSGWGDLAITARPDLGLETMVDAYIRAIESDPTGRSHAITTTRHELVQSLIPFAEKVLVVANSRELFTRSRREYVRFLQAMGNSLLVQLNELADRTGRQALSQSEGASETRALGGAFGGDATDVLARVHAGLLAAMGDPDLDPQARSRLETTASVVANEIGWASAWPAGPAHPPSVLEALLAHLRAGGGVGGDRREIAVATLEERFNELLRTPSFPSRLEAIDELIAALEYQRVAALERDRDSEDVKNLAAAIEAAYERRASMLYIRPSSAYLRSSYPSTTLQDDPTLQWDNMLGRHALRSLPFAPQFDQLLAGSERRRERQIQAEIDKRFWQNINRVRVAGGGDVNYAIAKDPVGNWYVKSYSADPREIIESARNLALFNIGAGAGVDLLGDAEGDGPLSSQAGNAPASWRERQLASFRAQDLEHARGVLAEIASLSESMRDSIGASPARFAQSGDWRGAVLAASDASFEAELYSVLAASASSLPTEDVLSPDSIRSAHDLTRRVASSLGALAAFAASANEGLDAMLPTSEQPDVGERARIRAIGLAKAFVRARVQDPASRLVERRRAQVDRYRSALEVLGRASPAGSP